MRDSDYIASSISFSDADLMRKPHSGYSKMNNVKVNDDDDDLDAHRDSGEMGGKYLR